MATSTPRTHTEKPDDLRRLERVQSILINATEGRRSVGDDREYGELRRQLARLKAPLPPMLRTHPSVDSFVAYIRKEPDRRGAVQSIRAEFAGPLDALHDVTDPQASADATSWTGIPSRAARLTAVRTFFPVAQAAIEGLIAELSAENGNGAPILDHRAEAIEHLRALHQALGDLLVEADRGHLDDEMGAGLAAEAARFAKRTARALRDDPLPYVTATMLYSVLSLCGLPGLGGHLAGMALTIKKGAGRS